MDTITSVASKPRTKLMDCRVCGVPMEVNIQTVNPPQHFECGISVAIDAMRQMQAKSGPYYERYLNGMRAYAESAARRHKDASHSS